MLKILYSLIIIFLLVLFFLFGIFTASILEPIIYAPSNYINESQIYFYEDKVCIDIINASLGNYAGTGSMRAVLDENSNGIKIPIKQTNINLGDIVTYKDGNDLIIHRVVDIKIKDSQTYYLMKGDRNSHVDGWINESQMVYKTIAIIY